MGSRYTLKLGPKYAKKKLILEAAGQPAGGPHRRAPYFSFFLKQMVSNVPD
jgi:hypothetical protein